MRVTHTIASISSRHGGPSRTVPALCSALTELGVSTSLLTLGDQTDRSPGDTRGGTLEFPVSKSFLGRFLSVGALRDRLFQVGSELVHDHGIWLPTNHAAVAAAQATNLPLVISPRGMLEPWSMHHHRIRKQAAWWAFQRRDLHRAALLHATSEMEARHIRDLGLKQPIAVIPNGVHLSESRSMHQNKGEHIALFLSRIHPKKGLLTLVEAWAMARPEGWRAVVAGPDDGGHRARVVSAVNSAGLTEVFSFLDEVEGEQKAALLQRSSLFVLPSFSENFGVAVAEALGAGVPVITTTATPWEGLEWHRCGWWVDPDAESLAGALREATDLSNDSRREMGERGREFVSREFGWLGVGRRMREAYEWILRGGATPSFIHAE